MPPGSSTGVIRVIISIPAISGYIYSGIKPSPRTYSPTPGTVVGQEAGGRPNIGSKLTYGTTMYKEYREHHHFAFLSTQANHRDSYVSVQRYQ